MSENAKLYTVFVGTGYGGAGGAPKTFITNEALLRRMESSCNEVSFIARDLSKGSSIESVVSELEDLKENLDGVLIIGVSRNYELAFTGLPTIVVYNLFNFMNIPYELYREKGKILTATVDRMNITSPSVSSRMFQDLVEKVKLISVLKKMKESTMLSISPYRYLHAIDYQGDIHEHFPVGYNQTYIHSLEQTIGVKLIRITPAVFYRTVQMVDEGEALETAKLWMSEAKEVRDTTESEVVKSAKMYLAFEMLRQQHDAVAVSTMMRSLRADGGKQNLLWRGNGKGEDAARSRTRKVANMAWPSLGVIEFQKRGFAAVCQDYPNIAVTHLLGLYALGRPSMLGDLMVDTFNQVDIILHCGAPINPHGDDRVPYVIWSHAQSPVRGTKKPGSGAGVQVELPVDEPVTVWKADILNKRILVHTGRSVDGHSLYRGLDGIMCRTKLIARVDADKVQSHFCPSRYGIHRAATFGDLREKIKNIGVLIGFEVIEEDR